MRERAQAAARRARQAPTRPTVVDLHVPRARRCASCAATRRRSGSSRASRSSIPTTSSRSSRSSSPPPIARRARAAQWTISAWKNALVLAGRRRSQAAQRRRRSSQRRAPTPTTTTRCAAYQAVDFDDLIALPVALLDATPTRARAGASAARTCSSTSTRTPIRRSTGCCSALVGERAPFTAVGDDDQAIYGWRGATIDNLARAAARLSGAQGRQARAELPLDGAHPALGQRADRQQPEALRQAAVERARRTATRSASRRRADDEAEAEMVRATASRRSSSSGARRFATSRSSIAATTRRACSRRRCARSNVPYDVSGGQSLLRRGRDQGLRRVPAPDRQRRRRSGVPARGHDAEARHRRRRRSQALGDIAGDAATRASSPRRSTPELAAPCRRGSARRSRRSAR